jgi:hypothetical protein
MADRDDAQVRADGDPAVEEPHAVPELVAVPELLGGDDDTATAGEAPARGGCRTDRHGWAGAHLHGAVRPRRRAVGRGRPPGRWC